MTSSFEALATRWRDLAAAPRPRYVGVYFLIRRDVVVYVGQSADIEQRVGDHRARRGRRDRWRMIFDRITWIDVPVDDLAAYEGALIRNLTPRYNLTAPPDDSRDTEIVARLGLGPIDPQRAASFLRRRLQSFPRGKHSKRARYMRARAKRREQRAQRERARRLFDGLEAILRSAS